MKTKLSIITLFAIVVTALFALVGCTGGNVADEGVATVIVENRDGSFTKYEVDLSLLKSHDEGALSVLEYLGSSMGGITYSVNYGGGYGGYVSSIGALIPGASEYVAVYTTERVDFAVATEWMPTVSTVECDGLTLTYSGNGISSMTVNDGTAILFRIERY